jgi:hypothetical protein
MYFTVPTLRISITKSYTIILNEVSKFIGSHLPMSHTKLPVLNTHIGLIISVIYVIQIYFIIHRYSYLVHS